MRRVPVGVSMSIVLAPCGVQEGACCALPWVQPGSATHVGSRGPASEAPAPSGEHICFAGCSLCDNLDYVLLYGPVHDPAQLWTAAAMGVASGGTTHAACGQAAVRAAPRWGLGPRAGATCREVPACMSPADPGALQAAAARAAHAIFGLRCATATQRAAAAAAIVGSMHIRTKVCPWVKGGGDWAAIVQGQVCMWHRQRHIGRRAGDASAAVQADPLGWAVCIDAWMCTGWRPVGPLHAPAYGYGIYWSVLLRAATVPCSTAARQTVAAVVSVLAVCG